MLQILVFCAWFGALESAKSAVILAVGRSDWVAASSVGKVVGVAVFVSLGYYLLGFPGAVLGVLCATATGYFVLVVVTKMLGFDGRFMDLRFSVRVAISAFAGWWAIRWVTEAGFDNVLLHAVVDFVVVTAFWTRPLLAALQRARRGRLGFRKPEQSEPSPAG